MRLRIYSAIYISVSTLICATFFPFVPTVNSAIADAEIELTDKNCGQGKYTQYFKLPDGYNRYEFPTERNETSCQFKKVPIAVGVRIRNIRGVVDLNEELSMEVDLITTWRDYHLAEALYNKTEDDLYTERGSKYVNLESSFIEKIWQPDIVFSKSISITKAAVHSSRVNQRPSRLKIFPGGWVELYTRLLVTLYCPMDFKYFPADTQKCHVWLRSYSFSNDDVDVVWQMAQTNGTSGEFKEVVFLYERSHPNYRIHLHDVRTEIRRELDALNQVEEFTAVGFSVSIKRKLTFHITQTFIPILFLVVITWLTFFIPLSNLEARIAVVMTTLLTMTNKFSEVASYTPNVSYISAIDIYMLTSITIVFITLFEFTFLYWIRMGRSEYVQSRKSMKMKLPANTEMEEFELEDDHRVKNLFFLQVRNYVEVYGFSITLIFFALFNIVFWPWVLICSGYFENDVDYNYNSRL